MGPRTGALAFGATIAAALLAGSAGAQTIAITGGTVYPVSGPRIEHGTVVIRDGKIVAVGANVPVPAGAREIDAAGMWVTPGLINAQTTLGLAEGNTPDQSGGYNDTRPQAVRGIAASFTAWEGLNPASTFIPPTRKDGITTALVGPARGNLVDGKSAIIDLTDGPAASMLVRAPVAMVAELGEVGGASRGEVVDRLRELLSDVKTYGLRKAAYDNNGTRAFAAPRADLEALLPVVNGTLPVVIEADRASDIRAALDLAREFNLHLVISGGAEAWEVAKELAAARVPVMTGAMNNIPGSFATLGNRQENAGLLRAAGVPVIIIGNGGGPGEDNFNARNIRYEAGNAVAYGMKWDDALRAITLTPATVFGVADRVGSLAAGHEADVVVWSGDPFEFATVPEHVFVRGVEYTAPTRQDLLTERYRHLPGNFRAP